MQEEVAVAQHWGRPSILDNILQALAREGIDPTRPTYFDILPYDQLHARGRTLSRARRSRNHARRSRSEPVWEGAGQYGARIHRLRHADLGLLGSCAQRSVMRSRRLMPSMGLSYLADVIVADRYLPLA